MKNTFLVLLLFVGFLPLTLCTQHYNPRNTIIAVDMDDVFVESHKYTLGAYFLNLIFLQNPTFLWKMATDSQFRKEIMHLYSRKGINNGGSTYNLAMTAQLYPAFQSYFDVILKKFHTSRSLVADVIKLLIDIKSAGYTIIVATNRDRMGVELMIEHLHFNTLYYGAPLFNTFITAQKAHFEHVTTLTNGVRFSRLVPNPVYDNYILSVPAFKPAKAYYKSLRDTADTHVKNNSQNYETLEPHLIFFDDQIKNVTGAALSGFNIKAFVVPQIGKAEQMRRDLESIGVVIPQEASIPAKL